MKPEPLNCIKVKIDLVAQKIRWRSALSRRREDFS